MPGPKFDTVDGDLIFGNDNIGFDSDGHMMITMGKNMMVDTETGDINFTIGVESDPFDEDDD